MKPPRPPLPHSIPILCYEWATRRCYMDSSLKNRIVEEKRPPGREICPVFVPLCVVTCV